MDENADRVHVPGQHGVPERDIEPLWPPDQVDGFGPPGWGAPPPAPPAAAPSGPAVTPSGPAAPSNPAAAPPAVPLPATPGYPAVGPALQRTEPGNGRPPAGPPAPVGYPSLSGDGPTSTGWEPPAPTATGWAPAPGPPPAGQVDLNLPFTLDQPTSLAPNRSSSPSTAYHGGSAGTGDGMPQGSSDGGTVAFGTDDGRPHLDGEPHTGDSGPDSTGGEPESAGHPGGADEVAGPAGTADDAPRLGRPPTESPWAQPPQRPAPEGVRPAEASDLAGATEPVPQPTWAVPAQPLPPLPRPESGPPPPSPAGPYPPVRQPPLHGVPTPQHGAPPQHGVGGPPTVYQAGPTPSAPTDLGAAQPVEAGSPAAAYPGPGTPQPPHPPTPQDGPAQPGPPYDATQPGPPYDATQAGTAQGPYAAMPPGPFPPQPAWNPAPWQQQGVPPVAPPVPGHPYQPPETASRMPPAYPEQAWTPELGGAPTAEDFARRRQARPADPVATMGVRAVVNKTGLVKLPPGRHELELKRDIEMVRRNFGGLRQVTVVNPKGGAGKTVAILLLAMTFGQKRGGYVLAWDNNETQGTLGMRAQQDFHSRTVRDLLRDLGQFHGAHGRVGDLSQYVRSQGEGMFDVLASDESATGGEMLTAAAFGEIREVVSRFYKLIFVDTGNNVRAQNWQAAMDATDQLVVTMSARNDSAETAARMLDHLEQSGRQRLVRQAVTVVSMPPSRKEIDLPAIEEHFAARTRAVLLAPYERLIDTGEPLRYAHLSAATRDAWLKIAAAVAEGL
ncbi:chromosome partitioning protein [Micromonospora radicis]